MATAAHTGPVAHTSAPTHHHYTTLGLDSRKVAIWAFIGSECMLFVSLISTYLIYKGRSVVGPFPHEAWTDPSTGEVFRPILNIPVTSASTFVLLMSSLFMVLALAAVENKGKPGYQGKLLGNSSFWILATAIAGATFLGFQAYEYMHAYSELNLKLSSGAYGSTFFMLTGFHGFHVFVGMTMLLFITIRIMKGHFTPERHFGFEGAAWYWHFVDVVWLGLYIVVYWL